MVTRYTDTHIWHNNRKQYPYYCYYMHENFKILKSLTFSVEFSKSLPLFLCCLQPILQYMQYCTLISIVYVNLQILKQHTILSSNISGYLLLLSTTSESCVFFCVCVGGNKETSIFLQFVKGLIWGIIFIIQCPVPNTSLKRLPLLEWRHDLNSNIQQKVAMLLARNERQLR